MVIFWDICSFEMLCLVEEGIMGFLVFEYVFSVSLLQVYKVLAVANSVKL